MDFGEYAVMLLEFIITAIAFCVITFAILFFAARIRTFQSNALITKRRKAMANSYAYKYFDNKHRPHFGWIDKSLIDRGVLAEYKDLGEGGRCYRMTYTQVKKLQAGATVENSKDLFRKLGQLVTMDPLRNLTFDWVKRAPWVKLHPPTLEEHLERMKKEHSEKKSYIDHEGVLWENNPDGIIALYEIIRDKKRAEEVFTQVVGETIK